MLRFNHAFRAAPRRRRLALAVAVISLLSAATIAVAEEKAAKPAANPLVGIWRVQSLSFGSGDGKSEDVPLQDEAPCNAVFTDKTFALRMGEKVVSEMTYTIDAAKTPCTIDAKSPDGPIVGLYERKGDELKISLNDEARGRPADFDKRHGNMVLVLRLRRFASQPLFVMNADGSGLRQLEGPAEFTANGSPDWSHDGRRIAYDTWRSVFGEGCSDARIFVIDVEGGPPKDIGRGAMPSWSPDDKQLTYSEYAPQRGIWVMNADGSERKLIEGGAWGSQWSPVRNEIVFSVSGGATNLCVYDVDKKQRRMLLDRSYGQIYWGPAWSPDGKWIAFKGVLSDGSPEIAAVSVEGEKKGLKVILPSSAAPEINNCNCTMTWGGAGNQIIIAMQTKNDRQWQFHVFDFTGEKPTALLPGFPTHWGGCDPAASPDGKRVAFSAVPAEKPETAKKAEEAELPLP